jgi:hypothetical protein
MSGGGAQPQRGGMTGEVQLEGDPEVLHKELQQANHLAEVSGLLSAFLQP